MSNWKSVVAGALPEDGEIVWVYISEHSCGRSLKQIVLAKRNNNEASWKWISVLKNDRGECDLWKDQDIMNWCKMDIPEWP